MKGELEMLWTFRWRVVSGLIVVLGTALLVAGLWWSTGLPPIN